jgi:DNA-directed RNA polymerase subunit omega
MARVTIEDCLERVDNMYELVHLATRRARQLYKGSNALVRSKNRVVVTALREIANGAVRHAYAGQGGDSSESGLPPMPN